MLFYFARTIYLLFPKKAIKKQNALGQSPHTGIIRKDDAFIFMSLSSVVQKLPACPSCTSPSVSLVRNAISSEPGSRFNTISALEQRHPAQRFFRRLSRPRRAAHLSIST